MVSDENSRLVGVAPAIEMRMKKDDEMTCPEDDHDDDHDADRDRDKLGKKKSNNMMYYCVIAAILTIVAVMRGIKTPFTSQSASVSVSASASASALRYTEAATVPIEDIDLFLVNSNQGFDSESVDVETVNDEDDDDDDDDDDDYTPWVPAALGACPTDVNIEPPEYLGPDETVGGVYYGLNFDCGRYTKLRMTDWTGCANLCNQDEYCVTFSFSGGKCYLHDKWKRKKCNRTYPSQYGDKSIVSGVCRQDYEGNIPCHSGWCLK